MADDHKDLQNKFENRALRAERPFPIKAARKIARGNLLTGENVQRVTLHGKPTGEMLGDYTRRMRERGMIPGADATAVKPKASPSPRKPKPSA